MCFLKYDYKLKIENMVVPVGTTGVNGLRWSMRGSARPRWTISFQRCPQSRHPCPPRHLQASQGGSIPKFIWNSHFIKNIPKPSLYQILGCSTDAEFYARVDHRPWIQNFYKEFPYGSEYGYITNLSIVAVPDHPIHGFVWSEGEWMIQASIPSSTLPNFKVRIGRAGGWEEEERWRNNSSIWNWSAQRRAQQSQSCMSRWYQVVCPPIKVEYPQVDLCQLNQHFLRNIPKPENLPIHRCSNDPEFHNPCRLASETLCLNFFRPHPFRSEYGYDPNLNLGIVPVPVDHIHGYRVFSINGPKIIAYCS